MEQLPPLGTGIREIIGPTQAIYAPLLQKNAKQIRSVMKKTFSFGPSPRQQLDVYTPEKPSTINGRRSVFIWLYGGGFVRGDRTLQGFADELVYSNVASFFAIHFGYTVVIPDYRLVGTHEDAKFPSGGEDAALTVQWILDHPNEVGGEPIDLFALGNSAGGVHLSTFLLSPAFTNVRRSVFSGTRCRLRGIVLLSAPLDLEHLQGYRAETLKSYYGVGGTNWPTGLLKAARENGTLDFLGAGCRVLILNAEYDPLDEVQSGRDKFIKEWMLIDGDAARNALAVDTMIGHNHISPSYGLGTGIDHEEAWGFNVGSFFESQRKLSRS